MIERKKPPKPSPKSRQSLIIKHRKQFLTELKMTCSNRRLLLESNNHFETVRPPNMISAIKDAITILASKQKLADLNASIKKEFNPLFQPIPHVDTT